MEANVSSFAFTSQLVDRVFDESLNFRKIPPVISTTKAPEVNGKPVELRPRAPDSLEPRALRRRTWNREEVRERHEERAKKPKSQKAFPRLSGVTYLLSCAFRRCWTVCCSIPFLSYPQRSGTLLTKQQEKSGLDLVCAKLTLHLQKPEATMNDRMFCTMSFYRILFKDKDRNWDEIENKLRSESDMPMLKTSNKVQKHNDRTHEVVLEANS